MGRGCLAVLDREPSGRGTSALPLGQLSISQGPPSEAASRCLRGGSQPNGAGLLARLHFRAESTQPSAGLPPCWRQALLTLASRHPGLDVWLVLSSSYLPGSEDLSLVARMSIMADAWHSACPDAFPGRLDLSGLSLPTETVSLSTGIWLAGGCAAWPTAAIRTCEGE